MRPESKQFACVGDHSRTHTRSLKPITARFNGLRERVAKKYSIITTGTLTPLATSIYVSVRTTTRAWLGASFDDRRAQLRNSLIFVVVGLWLLVGRAAAFHDKILENLECPPPSGFEILFQFLHDIGVLATYSGILFGGLGLIVGGLMIALPLGQDWARRGKEIIRLAVIGTAILLLAPFVIEFIAMRLGGGVC